MRLKLDRRTLGRLALGTLGLAIGVVGVLALKEATLSTHAPVTDARATELIVKGRNHAGERSQSLDEMVQAQVLTCRLEVNSDPEGSIESLGDGRYRVVLTPALDETNRRQFRGCVEDFMIDHLQIDVLELDQVS